MAENAQTTDQGPRPIVPFLQLKPEPHLVGKKCRCGAIFVDSRPVACAKCGADGPFTETRLSNHGKVYVFSVVHQSFPGIKTPYISVIVDLPEGATVRSNLIDFDPEEAEKNPQKVFGMPVEMTTSVAGKDREGHDVIVFSYRPARA
jgi:uncharacterized OB-fold protein